MTKRKSIIGWILAFVFFLVIIIQQLTITQYKAACRDYAAAIQIYEGLYGDKE